MEDYIYEIMGKDDEVIETDYVCLDSAIEYAKENGGKVINRLWLPIDENGNINREQEVIAAEVVWSEE